MISASMIKNWIREFPKWEEEDQITLVLGALALIALVVGCFGWLISDLAGLKWGWCCPTTIVGLAILLIVLYCKGMDKVSGSI